MHFQCHLVGSLNPVASPADNSLGAGVNGASEPEGMAKEKTALKMTRRTKVILAVGCLAMAALVALPSFVRIEVSSRRGCYATMKMIEGAKLAWMTDNHKTVDDTPTWTDLVGPQKYFLKIPKCPHGGTYSLGKVGESPICSIAEDTTYFRKNESV